MLKEKVSDETIEEMKQWVKDLGVKNRNPKIIGSGGNINKIYKLSNRKEVKLFIKPITNFNYENMLPNEYKNRDIISLITIRIDELGISPYLSFNFRFLNGIYPYDNDLEILKIDKIIYEVYPINKIDNPNPNWFYNDQNDLIIPISNISDNELFKPFIELYKANWIMLNLNSQTLFIMSQQDVNSLNKIPKDKIELICSVMPLN